MLAIIARAGDHAAERSKSRAWQKVPAIVRHLPRKNGHCSVNAVANVAEGHRHLARLVEQTQRVARGGRQEAGQKKGGADRELPAGAA
jgi:hypothetical protein